LKKKKKKKKKKVLSLYKYVTQDSAHIYCMENSNFKVMWRNFVNSTGICQTINICYLAICIPND
jgi:hypothetical protein